MAIDELALSKARDNINSQDSEIYTFSKKIADLADLAGRKIYKNQITCKVRQTRIGDIIDAHNKAHGDK